MMLDRIAKARCARDELFLRDSPYPSLVVRVAVRRADVVARSPAVPGGAREEHRRVPPSQARAARRGEAAAASRVATHARRCSGLSRGNGREEREESVQEGRHQRTAGITMP